MIPHLSPYLGNFSTTDPSPLLKLLNHCDKAKRGDASVTESQKLGYDRNLRLQLM